MLLTLRVVVLPSIILIYKKNHFTHGIKMRIVYTILFCMLVLTITTNISSASNNSINIYLFKSDTCSPCNVTESILYKTIQNYPNIDLHFITIDNKEGYSQYQDFRIAYNMITEASSVPAIFIGNDYIVGYKDGIGNNIEELIKKYQNGTAGTTGDMVFTTPELITMQWFSENYLKDVVVQDNCGLNIYVFYTSFCGPCIDLVNHINSKKWGDNVHFYLFNVSSGNITNEIYSDRMNAAFLNAFVIKERVYPQIFVGDDFYKGYDSSMLEKMIEYYGSNDTQYSRSNVVFNRYNDELESYAKTRASIEKGTNITVKPTHKNDQNELFMDTNVNNPSNTMSSLLTSSKSIPLWILMMLSIVYLLYKRTRT